MADTDQIRIRVSQSMLERIDDEVRRTGQTRSDIVEACLTAYLDKLEAKRRNSDAADGGAHGPSMESGHS